MVLGFIRVIESKFLSSSPVSSGLGANLRGRGTKAAPLELQTVGLCHPKGSNRAYDLGFLLRNPI